MTRLKLVALLLVLVALCGLPLYAQSPSLTQNTVVNIPFEFVAGEATLPPGEYTILNVKEGVLQFIGPTGSTFVQTGEVLGPSVYEESKLVFIRQGNTMVLHQVIPAGSSHGHDLVHRTGAPEV